MVIQDLRSDGELFVSEFNQSFSSFVNQEFTDPILNTVEILPINELALMAESLVNLTSFKRRVSMAQETVGGPIDVAVISKGDGFVWIKRKHYFNKDLNPHFLTNYYKNDNLNKNGNK